MFILFLFFFHFLFKPELDCIKKLNTVFPLSYIKTNKKMIATNTTAIFIESFWNSIEKKGKKLNQQQRYEAQNAPEYIKKFIAIGGGPKMGVTLEKYARFQFPNLKKRNAGKNETGYDHILEKADGQKIYIEQKSSGHWDTDDFKWQHVEENHKWELLLLCGITYTHVRFWIMDRATFQRLVNEKKITNQGNKAENSSEGKWFSYSAVKDSLKEVMTAEDLETAIM